MIDFRGLLDEATATIAPPWPRRFAAGADGDVTVWPRPPCAPRRGALQRLKGRESGKPLQLLVASPAAAGLGGRVAGRGAARPTPAGPDR